MLQSIEKHPEIVEGAASIKCGGHMKMPSYTFKSPKDVRTLKIPAQ